MNALGLSLLALHAQAAHEARGGTGAAPPAATSARKVIPPACTVTFASSDRGQSYTFTLERPGAPAHTGTYRTHAGWDASFAGLPDRLVELVVRAIDIAAEHGQDEGRAEYMSPEQPQQARTREEEP